MNELYLRLKKSNHKSYFLHSVNKFFGNIMTFFKGGLGSIIYNFVEKSEFETSIFFFLKKSQSFYFLFTAKIFTYVFAF